LFFVLPNEAALRLQKKRAVKIIHSPLE